MPSDWTWFRTDACQSHAEVLTSAPSFEDPPGAPCGGARAARLSAPLGGLSAPMTPSTCRSLYRTWSEVAPTRRSWAALADLRPTRLRRALPRRQSTQATGPAEAPRPLHGGRPHDAGLCPYPKKLPTTWEMAVELDWRAVSASSSAVGALGLQGALIAYASGFAVHASLAVSYLDHPPGRGAPPPQPPPLLQPRSHLNVCVMLTAWLVVGVTYAVGRWPPDFDNLADRYLDLAPPPSAPVDPVP